MGATTPLGHVGPAGEIGPPGLPGAPSTVPGRPGPLSITAIIASGAAVVANNVMPPGVAIGYPTVLNTVTVRAGTTPTGSGLTVVVRQNGALVASVGVAAGATSARSAGLGVIVAARDVFTFDITVIGATTPGSDIAVDLAG